MPSAHIDSAFTSSTINRWKWIYATEAVQCPLRNDMHTIYCGFSLDGVSDRWWWTVVAGDTAIHTNWKRKNNCSRFASLNRHPSPNPNALFSSFKARAIYFTFDIQLVITFDLWSLSPSSFLFRTSEWSPEWNPIKLIDCKICKCHLHWQWANVRTKIENVKNVNCHSI